jgi:hypothetical protein
MELLGSTVAIAKPRAAKADSPFDSLRQSAFLEFQATVQLLAARAGFLMAADGVGIALLEENKFVYSVATSDSVPAVGSVVDRLPSDRTGFRLIVPITLDDDVAGFFELASKREFSHLDLQQITRLADLASIALEHRQAAERAGAETWEELQTLVAPVEWHAPPTMTQSPQPQALQPEKVGDVNSCASCGFPVSPGRALCVECELKSDAPAVASGELFSLHNQESWSSEHGYTVASLIVSALAAAIIFWLRR